MSLQKKKKIIFIEPKSPNLHIFSVFVIPRLGSLILGSIMKKLNWDVEVIIEENDPIDLDTIRSQSVDLVGISTITSTAPRAYTIADHIREMGIPVIMGGPHVSFLPDEALEHADFVIRGEGERALPVFIDRWLKKGDLTDVPHLSYKKDGKIIHNPKEDWIYELDHLPYPDFSLIRNGIKPTFGYKIVPVQTSRGCPFNCEFCSVTGMFGKRLRFRSIENIIQELRRYNDRKNVIFFYDDNFTANRGRAKELCRAMIKENFRFKWSTQVRADVAKDPELVQLMRRSGCVTVFIGFESIDPENLRSMQKQQSVEEIKTAIQVIAGNKIQVHGMFVFGFENDNRSVIKETIRFANSNPIGTCQFLILTPLPGTETFRKFKQQKRIHFYDWSLYDTHHAVFEPEKLTPDELQKAQIKAHQSFYSLRKILKRLITFRWDLVSIGLYARRLNRIWKKDNRLWLKILKLLRPNFHFNIKIDIRRIIDLSRKKVPAGNM
ncbi:MAG: B12-binding domain-containing radical SAM protein [Spirochaetes bacterium]|nr:B12-binding domain-containing radical SAM protein [Spirochaetota bacterium]